MKFYFGSVPDKFVDDDTYFECDGDQFYYTAEFGTNPGGLDDVTITDTAGRTIPVDVEAISELITVLNNCLQFREQVRAAAVQLDRYTTKGNEAVVDSHEVYYINN